MSSDWLLFAALWFSAMALVFAGTPLDAANPRTWGFLLLGVFLGLMIGGLLWKH